MPTVPRLSQPQIQERGLPQVRVPADAPLSAFGGGESLDRLGRAVVGAADTVRRIALDEKQKADDALSQKAYTEFVNRKNQRAWNPDDGALTRRGEQAIGLIDEYMPLLDQDAADIEKNMLKNESQRQFFRRMVEQEKRSFHAQLMKHSLAETEKFADETALATVESLYNDTVLNFHEPGRVEENLTKMRGAILSRADGKPKEWVDAKVAEAVSKTHAGVINRLLSTNQDLAAKSYFENHKEEITNADIRKNIEKVIEEGSLRGESQRRSDAIVSKAQTMTEALEEARKVKDPELRDEVVSRVKDYFSLKKLADNERTEDLHRRAADVIDRTGSIDNIPPEEWSQFSLSERSALKSYAEKIRDGTLSTDANTYYELVTLSSAPETRSKFMRMNLADPKIISKLSRSDWKKIVDIQAGLRKGDEKTSRRLDGIRSDMEIVKSSLRAAGIDPKDEEANLFYRQVDQQVLQLQERTGKKVTNEDIQRIVDNLLVQGTIEGSGVPLFGPFGGPRIFQRERRVFELEPGQSISIDPSEVPASDRAEIIRELRKRNKPVSDEIIRDWYVRGLNRGQ